MTMILTGASGTAAAATQAKYEALTRAAFLVRLRVDELLAIADSGGATNHTIVQLTGKAANRIRVNRNAGTLFLQLRDDNEGGTANISVLRSALPATGAFVMLYGFRSHGGGTTAQLALYSGATELAIDTSTAAYGALATGAGTGAITIGGTTSFGIDALYVFDRALTVGERQAEPASSLSGLIGGYAFAENTGSTSADVVSGGTALTLTGTTWNAAGTWDNAGVAAPTITGIAPTSGPVGTEVTITGTNLTGATVARHGPTVAMTGLVVDSATQARATIASGSPASGTIRITTPGGTAIGPTFTIPPVFTSLEITNPNTSYILGVLLAPITVRALDQFGATFLGTLADCVVSALTLPVTVVGTLTEPFVSGIATFDNLTPAASAGPPIEVITVATPLRCTVSLFPVTSAPVEATGGGGIPTLIARTASDHVLRIEAIVHAITGAVIEPTDIRYRISDASGVLVSATVTAPTNPDDWQIALTRALFTPTRGPMTLVLTLVAPVDSTETALQFTIAQGVRQ